MSSFFLISAFYNYDIKCFPRSEAQFTRGAEMSNLFLFISETHKASFPLLKYWIGLVTETPWPFFFSLCCVSPWLFRSLRSVRKARARQTETSVTDSRVTRGEMGDRKAWRGNRFFYFFLSSFSPFSFALADSEKLMNVRYYNLLFCHVMLPTVPSGMGLYWMVAELSQT